MFFYDFESTFVFLNPYPLLLSGGQEVEFHEIEIQLFHEIESF
jgi:hypothetical protein